MSKKNNKKNNEINPFNDLQVEHMTVPQLETEIKTKEKELQDFISKGKYPKAEICNKKIEYLKTVLKQKKNKGNIEASLQRKKEFNPRQSFRHR